MGCIMVVQSSIIGRARAVLTRVEMHSPMFRSYILGAPIAMFEGAWFASCMGVLTSRRRPIFRVVARDVIYYTFSTSWTRFLVTSGYDFRVVSGRSCRDSDITTEFFWGRRLDRKHPARFPTADLIRNVASATSVDGKRRYWIWQ